MASRVPHGAGSAKYIIVKRNKQHVELSRSCYVPVVFFVFLLPCPLSRTRYFVFTFASIFALLLRCGAVRRQCLRPLTWLNDEVVNMYMNLLGARDAEVGLSPSLVVS